MAGLVVPSSFFTSFSFFQFQMTLPEDRMGDVVKKLKDEMYNLSLTKIHASLAFYIVFRVNQAHILDVLRCLDMMGVGTSFGVVDVLPVLFSMPEMRVQALHEEQEVEKAAQKKKKVADNTGKLQTMFQTEDQKAEQKADPQFAQMFQGGDKDTPVAQTKALRNMEQLWNSKVHEAALENGRKEAAGADKEAAAAAVAAAAIFASTAKKSKKKSTRVKRRKETDPSMTSSSAPSVTTGVVAGGAAAESQSKSHSQSKSNPAVATTADSVADGPLQSSTSATKPAHKKKTGDSGKHHRSHHHSSHHHRKEKESHSSSVVQQRRTASGPETGATTPSLKLSLIESPKVARALAFGLEVPAIESARAEYAPHSPKTRILWSDATVPTNIEEDGSQSPDRRLERISIPFSPDGGDGNRPQGSSSPELSSSSHPLQSSAHAAEDANASVSFALPAAADRVTLASDGGEGGCSVDAGRSLIWGEVGFDDDDDDDIGSDDDEEDGVKFVMALDSGGNCLTPRKGSVSTDPGGGKPFAKDGTSVLNISQEDLQSATKAAKLTRRMQGSLPKSPRSRVIPSDSPADAHLSTTEHSSQPQASPLGASLVWDGVTLDNDENNDKSDGGVLCGGAEMNMTMDDDDDDDAGKIVMTMEDDDDDSDDDEDDDGSDDGGGFVISIENEDGTPVTTVAVKESANATDNANTGATADIATSANDLQPPHIPGHKRNTSLLWDSEVM